MTEIEKQIFISDHLYYELRWLLSAAQLRKVLEGKDHSGFALVIAQDAAFLHIRNLFEFFTGSGGDDISVTEFGPSVPYTSPMFPSLWKKPLNRHISHISKGRLKPTNSSTEGHLKDQVENFTGEILRLWKQFENDPAASAFAVVLREKREEAFRDRENDSQKGIIPMLSSI